MSCFAKGLSEIKYFSPTKHPLADGSAYRLSIVRKQIFIETDSSELTDYHNCRTYENGWSSYLV